MRLLSALDALFLQLETPDTPMHVGSLMLLELPAGRRRRDPFTAIRAHLAARIHLAPVFWHRLAPMPVDIASPAWIRADPDLDHHVRHMRLPAPGTQGQLEDAVARLHAGLLDRSRPLWEVTVIEGLASGEVGYYSKVHHAALDGQGGIAVAQAILDTQARPRKVAAAAREAPRLPPSTARLLGSALRHTIARYGAMVKGLPDVARSLARGAAVALSSSELRRKGLALGPRTPLNAPIGPERAFAMARIPLEDAKAIARHFGGKLNDAVLAICAGALRRQFARDRTALSRAMIGAVPVSLRSPGDTSAANQVSMMFVALGTQIADPVKRMQSIIAASGRAKKLAGSVKGAMPIDLPSLGIPWLMALVTPLYRRVTGWDRAPVIANLAISNVPGPQVPLYLAGMRLTAYHPVSIVTHGLGLNVTIVSYDGSLDFGILSARSAMPNPRAFARHLAAAHRELMKTIARGKVSDTA
jgi:WS/DGAT/MGAT family acyltransferase